jgi:hypothetical protein
VPSRAQILANPNRYLWNNHGIWFLALTVYPTAYTKERLRFSLCTRDLIVARQRRDFLLRLPSQRLMEYKRDLVIALFLSGGAQRAPETIAFEAAEVEYLFNGSPALANEVWLSP